MRAIVRRGPAVAAVSREFGRVGRSTHVFQVEDPFQVEGTMSRDLQSIELNPKRIAAGITAAIAALLVVYLLTAGWFSVEPHEQAVVLRFGKYQKTVGPGLHFKLPWVDTQISVDSSEKSLRLPYAQAEASGGDGSLEIDRGDQEDKLILTGDLYAAVVEWNVIWRVDDPRQYLFSFDGQAGRVEQVIVAVARSVMHRLVGDYSADEVLTGKREEITQMALREMSEALASYETGVSIVDLQMQRVTPPANVKPAFDEVNASIQERDQLVNEARRERNQMVPKAEAEQDRMIREAEGYASRKVAEASGEISALLAKYESYKAAPEETRRRLYIETMEKILQKSGPKTILDRGVKGIIPLLDLNQATDGSPRLPLTNRQPAAR
jgi:membrane protease subunit HflK